MMKKKKDQYAEKRTVRSRKLFDRAIKETNKTLKYLAYKTSFGDKDFADDLYQEALLAVDRASVKYRPGRGVKFETYAISAAQNSMIDVLRKRKRDSGHDTNIIASIAQNIRVNEVVATNLILSEPLQKIPAEIDWNSAIERMSPTCKKIFFMKINEIDTEQIVKHLGFANRYYFERYYEVVFKKEMKGIFNQEFGNE